MRKSFSARMMEVDTLDDPSFLNEQVFSFLTLRHLLYVGGVGLLDYTLFSSGKIGGEILGVLLILAAALLAFYPTKSVKMEAKIVGMIDYMLGGGEEKKKAKKKEENVKKLNNKKKTEFRQKEGKKEKLMTTSNISIIDYGIIGGGFAISFITFPALFRILVLKEALQLPEGIVVIMAFALGLGISIGELLYIARFKKLPKL